MTKLQLENWNSKDCLKVQATMGGCYYKRDVRLCIELVQCRLQALLTLVSFREGSREHLDDYKGSVIPSCSF
jgi:hypothetical protein